jgi:hypothetical protein
MAAAIKSTLPEIAGRTRVIFIFANAQSIQETARPRAWTAQA